ncbi:MAG: phosphate acyltransferase [Bacteroidales bacterium]|nr:phosphate acyltransferase [Bacteroidales bacterium]
MKIGLDVMGGDFAPEKTMAGAILAQKEMPSSDRIVLIGDKELIHQYLKNENLPTGDFDIVHAPETIGMGEHPIKAFSQKPNSSIATGFRLLKSNEIDAFASAGNSGVMLVGSMYSVNTIPGIIRPGISAIIPKENGKVGVLLDIGTNPDCKPDVMYQLAILGSLYANYVYDIEDPKIGLLNIGEEEEKGSILTQSVYRLMKNSKDFNFIGNVESRDLFNDKADVVVTDGFTGNVLIKQIEAIFEIMNKRGLVDDYFSMFNYENYGGSPILGINATVVLGHGISNEKAIKNMILLTKDVHDADLSKKIKKALS